MTFLSRDFNMAAPDSVDSKSNTESTVIETENIQDSPVFSDGQVKDKRCSSSRQTYRKAAPYSNRNRNRNLSGGPPVVAITQAAQENRTTLRAVQNQQRLDVVTQPEI